MAISSHRARHLALSLLIGLTLGRFEARALAQASPAATPGSALDHYNKGNVAFDLRRYVDAAREYEAAYEQHDDPALLFNIGQAYRYADDYPKAVASYKAYLRRKPRAKNRVEVLARISDLQQLMNQQQVSRDAPPNGPEPTVQLHDTPLPSPLITTDTLADGTPRRSPAPAPLSDDKARTKRIAGIGLIVGGVALVAAGGALVGVAYATQSAYNHPAAGKTFDPNAPGRIKAEQVAGGVLLGVGIGAAAAGAVLEVLGRRAPSRVAWAPLLGDHSVGFTLAGVWP